MNSATIPTRPRIGGFINFKVGSTWRAGYEVDGEVVDLTTLRHFPLRQPFVVDDLLSDVTVDLPSVMTEAELAIARGDATRTATGLEYGPPVLRPRKIICVGFNYLEHAGEFGVEIPRFPDLFAKFPNALTGHLSSIILPADSTKVDFEGELAAIIGRRCKRISASEAMEVVAGYTVMNDVSARDLQFATSQFTYGKSPDTFAPMGPRLVVRESVADPQCLRVTTHLNGECVQDASTSQMIRSVSELIEFITKTITLEPGDVIATGTPSGVGYKRNPPLYMKAGDVVEVEIDGIGHLTNHVLG